MYNESVHQLLQRVPTTAWSASAMCYTHRILACNNILQNFWLNQVLVETDNDNDWQKFKG